MSEKAISVITMTRNTIHNGPGSRLLVLTKGCPLRCKWCSTPESQNYKPQLTVTQEKCIQCGNCLSVCKKDALTMTADGVVIDRKKCDNCMECTTVCHSKTLLPDSRKYTIDEIVENALKCKIFFDMSGGGVTLSGGEFLQCEFEEKLELIKELRKNDIHIGIDSCGHVPSDHIREVLPYVDFFLWDIKQMNSKLHKEITGVPNELILSNLKIVSDYGTDIYFRCPIIPGMTDDREHIVRMCELGQSIPSLKSVDLLPLHHLGKKRYESIGWEYPLDNTLKVPDALINEYHKLALSYGLPARVVG